MVQEAALRARGAAADVERYLQARITALEPIAATRAVREGDVAGIEEYLDGLDIDALGFDGGIGWIDDPTNEDPAYERPRLRKSLGRRGGEERIEAALRTGIEAAAKRLADGNGAASLICVHATQAAPGLTRLDRQFAGEGETAVHSMRILLAVAGAPGTTRVIAA